jgi:hypothetical protein
MVKDGTLIRRYPEAPTASRPSIPECITPTDATTTRRADTMIDTLTPYPAYKDSGLPWLGQVPEHWEVRRMKFLFRNRSEKDSPMNHYSPLLKAKEWFVEKTRYSHSYSN